MQNEFSELSYLVRHAPVDIVLGGKRMVWMNNRWYLSIGFNIEQSVPEEKIDEAFKWLVNDWWKETQGHPYKGDE